MNEHIALVKRWLADPKSVTKAELKANADAAWATADAADAAADAAGYAAADGYAADAQEEADWAAFWVREYERLTDE